MIHTPYTRITSVQAKEMLDDNQPKIFLDVRDLQSFKEKHIPGAIHIRNTEIEQVAPAKLQDKDAQIIVYCRSGMKSASCAKRLIALGYTNVWDMGGILSWKFDTVSGA